MRALLPLLIIATLPQAALASPTPTEAPQRMPGLWLVNHGPTGERAKASSFHICVGKQDGDDVLATPGNALGNCRDQAWSKEGAYMYYRAVCDAKGSTATVEGRFAGDFQYNFQGELSTSYAPALNGVSTERTEIDGRRLAPCRSDQPVGTFLIKGQNGVGNLNLAEPIRQPAR